MMLVFRFKSRTLFSLIQVPSVFSKFTEVAMVAMPIKRKILTNPSAANVPKQEAKKLLKNFISYCLLLNRLLSITLLFILWFSLNYEFLTNIFLFKDRVCGIVLRNLGGGLK